MKLRVLLTLIKLLLLLIKCTTCNDKVNNKKYKKITVDNIDNYNDYIDNEIDMKLTYRSNVEKLLQIFVTIHQLNSRELITKLHIDSNKYIDIFFTVLPKPIKDFLTFVIDRNNNNLQLSKQESDKELSHVIYPGTLWCGGGSIARSINQVGVFSRTDFCCRKHDSCPLTIDAGRNFDFLKNNGIFTRSACSCDITFYKCLKKINTIIARNIGTTYFNILRPQCFSYYYPIKYCEKYDEKRKNDKKCFKYKFDYTNNKTLDWFDLPDF